MTWSSCPIRFVRSVVMATAIGTGVPGALLLWFSTGAIGAAQQAVWELQPYRIRVLLCADASPLWTDTTLPTLAAEISRRARAEFGLAWELSVQTADADVCRAALGADDTGALSLPADLRADGETDKLVIVTLRATAGEPTVQVSEYDVRGDRWDRGPPHAIGLGNRLTPVVFESLAQGVASLAVVKSVADNHVVVRLRGGLLPVRNPRRAPADVGSIFQIAERGRATAGDVELPEGYLVVDRVDGHLLECHGVGELSGLSAPDVTERVTAIGVRSLHAATRFTVTMAGAAGPVPLAGCDVYLSDLRDGPGTCLGRTDDQGRVVVAATERACWLQLRLGAVLLAQRPIVPGWRAQQTVATRIDLATLATAAAVRDCHTDVAELAALRSAYLARCQARERAGRADEAQSLRAEAQTAIEQRVPAVRERINRRRQSVERLYPDQADAAKQLWDAVEQLLVALTAQYPAAGS